MIAPNHETNSLYPPASRITSSRRRRSRVLDREPGSGTFRAPATRRPSGWKRIAGYVVAGGIAAAALGAGARPWFFAEPAGAAAPSVAHDAARHVTVARPERQQVGAVSLPATVEPFQSARLYARVSGYVKGWNVELGAIVHAGDVLAVIDTPDLDQELLQARSDFNEANAAVAQAEAELAESQAALDVAQADRARSQADLALAESRLRRRESLFQKNATSQDDLDTAVRDRDARQADVAASDAAIARQAANLKTRAAAISSRRAAVESHQANVRRLEELQAFRNVVAPFDGVVTRRNAEVGQLVTAGGTSPQEELYVVAQTDRVRVQVPVPQSDAVGIRDGAPVTVRIPELPGQDIAATVTRTSQSVDPASRTLLAEVELSNADRLLSPGLYAEVVIQTQTAQTTWVVPANTLRMQVDGPHVVLADGSRRLEVRPVRLGRDYGRTVAILEGLSGEERLVVNPSADLRDGMTVSFAMQPQTATLALHK